MICLEHDQHPRHIDWIVFAARSGGSRSVRVHARLFDIIKIQPGKSSVHRKALAILFCYLPLKLHSPVLFLRMYIGNVEMLAENATPTL